MMVPWKKTDSLIQQINVLNGTAQKKRLNNAQKSLSFSFNSIESTMREINLFKENLSSASSYLLNLPRLPVPIDKNLKRGIVLKLKRKENSYHLALS